MLGTVTLDGLIINRKKKLFIESRIKMNGISINLKTYPALNMM